MIEQQANGTYQATVDERVYTFSKWGAEKALKTLAELSRVAGESLSIAASAFANSGTTNDIDPNLIGSAVKALTDGLGSDTDATLRLMKRLCCDGTLCDDRPILFDTHFRGGLLSMIKVVRAALEVQFGDFFSAFKSKADDDRKLAATSSPSNTKT